eukprot:516378-Amphidinium_carterae.3
MNRLWLPGFVFTMCGLMGLEDTVVILTSEDAGLATTLTLVKVFLCPHLGLKHSVYPAEFLAVVRALEECKPKGLVSDCKGVASCLHALKAGRRQPKGRHRDLESRALAALPG